MKMDGKKKVILAVTTLLVVLLIILLILLLTFCTKSVYDIKFVVDDAIYEEIGTDDWGDEGISDPSKEGYDFGGWYTDGNYTNEWSGSISEIEADSIFYGKWELTTYNITYELNGGTNSTSNPDTYTIESSSIVLSAPTKEGYVFECWEEGNTIASGTTGDKTFTAKWYAIEYTATFVNNGTVVGSYTYTMDDTTIEEPEAVSNKVGYSASWEAYTLTTSNVTIEAEYEIIYYTATFVDGNFVVSKVEFTVEDDSITEPTPPTLDGMVSSWAEYELGAEDIIIAVIYIYVYTVQYETNGGTDISEATFISGYELTAVAGTTTRTGYTFAGWYTDKALETALELPMSITKSQTIYAKWEAIEYDITYSMDEGTNHADNPATYTIEEVVTLETPTKTGYQFVGWYDENSNEVTSIEVGTTGAIILTATWAEKKTVTWVISGTTVYSATYVEGESIPTASEYTQTPYKEDTAEYTYTFSGWETKTLDDDTIVYVAGFDETKNSYAVTFYDIEKEEIAEETQTIEYGANATSITAETVYGYDFIGWYADANLKTEYDFDTNTITGNTAIYAKYTAKTYYITFTVGTTVLEKVSYTIENTAISEPTVTAKTGYEGTWEAYSISTTDLKDIVVYAEYTPITYNATFKDEDDSTIATVSFTIEDSELSQIPAVPTKDYYEVVWNSYTISASDMTIEAKYTAITYYAKFIDGTSTTTLEYTIETTTYTAPDFVGKEGYSGAWDKSYEFVEGGQTITASYEANTYTVVFNENGGSGTMTAMDCTYDVEQNLTANNFEYEGYNFAGWSTTSTGSVEYTDSESIVNLTAVDGSSITLYAVWKETSLSVNFISNSGSYDNMDTSSQEVISVEADETNIVTAPTTSSLANYIAGYYLDGWYTSDSFETKFDFDDEITEEIDVYAKWVESFEFDMVSATSSSSSLSINNASSDNYTYEIIGLGTISTSDIEIPTSFYGVDITSIADGAFADETSILSVVIHDTITYIGLGAFSGCNSITSITIPFVGVTANDDVYNYFGHIFDLTETGDTAYLYHNDYVPESLKTIIVDSESVESCIAPSSFRKLQNIESVTIGSNITELGFYSFNYCLSLTTFVVAEGIVKIDDGCFQHCPLLEEFIIPNSVTEVGGVAFTECYELTSVVIGSGVKSIGNNAFKVCSALSSVIFAENSSLEILGTGVFYSCSSLETITFPTTTNGITLTETSYTSGGLFYDCTSLETVIWDVNATSLQSYMFCGCTNLVNFTTPENITSIPAGIFRECQSITEIYVPESVGSIGEYAFYQCYALLELTIPEKVSSIGTYAFYQCFAIRTITINSTSITTIEDYTFSRCTDLTSISIPSTVTSIGQQAFYLCRSLTSITIPSKVSSIGTYAFNSCYSLVEVYDQSTSLSFTKGNSSNGYTAYYALNVYTSASGSKLSITEDGFVLYTSGSYVYLVKYYGTETDITIPSEVTSIYQYAFYENDAITSITFVENSTLTSIGEKAFYCSSSTSIITSINLEANNALTTIGSYSFYGCKNITTITIPESVTKIGRNVFSNCSRLSSVVFEDPDTWYYTSDSSYTSGTLASNITATTSGTYLTSTSNYASSYLYKS